MHRNEYCIRGLRNSSFIDKKSINSDLDEVTTPKYVPTTKQNKIARRAKSNIIARDRPSHVYIQKGGFNYVSKAPQSRSVIKYIPKVSIGQYMPYPAKDVFNIPRISNISHKESFLTKQSSFYIAQNKPSFTVINSRQRNQINYMCYFTMPDNNRQISSATGLHKYYRLNRNPASIMN
jgi:hypothetical protein